MKYLNKTHTIFLPDTESFASWLAILLADACIELWAEFPVTALKFTTDSAVGEGPFEESADFVVFVELVREPKLSKVCSCCSPESVFALPDWDVNLPEADGDFDSFVGELIMIDKHLMTL